MILGHGYVERNEAMRWLYVGVDSHTTPGGVVTPTAITLDDGRKFDIDFVYTSARAYGDERVRMWYLVSVCDCPRELWWDNPSWHILVTHGDMGVRPHTPPGTAQDRLPR